MLEVKHLSKSFGGVKAAHATDDEGVRREGEAFAGEKVESEWFEIT